MTKRTANAALAALSIAGLAGCSSGKNARAQEVVVPPAADAAPSAVPPGEVPIIADEIPEAEPAIPAPYLGRQQTVIIVEPGGQARPAGPPAPAPGQQPFYYPIPKGPPISPLYDASRAAGGPRQQERGPERPLALSSYCTGELEAFDLEDRIERLRALESTAAGETKNRLGEAISRIQEQQTLVNRKARELEQAVDHAEKIYQRALDEAVESRRRRARPAS